MAIGSDRDVVHEARKATKRMRALARLFRDELGEPEFGRVNASLRDAAQRLAGARDAQVRLATLRSLAEHHPAALARAGIDFLGMHLERERARSGEPTNNTEVLEDIAAMRRQLARWDLLDRDFEDLAPGLRRIYKEGRKRYAHVKDEHRRAGANSEHPPSDQAMHDWRKRVKSLYYALDMLGGKRAKGARKATRRAGRLGDLLGEEHDLWMLSVYAEEHPDVFGGDSRAREDLLELIERRRRRLRKRALKLGARLYKRSPARFVQRLRIAFSR
jgi:CHAD domain-containing protein